MYKVIEEQKSFCLNERLDLPDDVTSYTVGGMYNVFVSISKAAYVVTSLLGGHLLTALLNTATLSEAIESVSQTSRVSNVQATEAMKEVLFQIEKNQFLAHSRVVEDVHGTLWLQCYLTKRCNLMCTHCYASSGPRASIRNELTTDEWLNVLQSYASFLSNQHEARPRITLTGGEPLLRKDLFEIAKFAKGLGIAVELFTNGILLRTAQDIHTLSDCVDLVQLSLDGATEKVNDAIRGSGTFKQIITSISMLAESQLPLRLAITLMPSNCRDLEDNLIDLLKRVGNARFDIRIGLANIQGRADSSVRFQNSWEGEQALRRLLHKLYRAGLRSPRKFVPNFKGVTCGYGRLLAISSDGMVYGCAIEEHPIGNVRSESFGDLASRALSLGEAASIDNIDGCKTCDLRYFCYGLCRLNNLFYKKSLFVSCCTPEKKQEVLRKLASREILEDVPGSDPARVGSFWLYH